MWVRPQRSGRTHATGSPGSVDSRTAPGPTTDSGRRNNEPSRYSPGATCSRTCLRRARASLMCTARCTSEACPVRSRATKVFLGPLVSLHRPARGSRARVCSAVRMLCSPVWIKLARSTTMPLCGRAVAPVHVHGATEPERRLSFTWDVLVADLIPARS